MFVQEFLLNNTVNCNLMSLTGYRTLVILDLLMKAPMSTVEINEFFLNNQYIKEKFCKDTLRIYINSLRAIGCEITRANKTTNNKYVLVSHPFNFDIPKSQLKAISKVYKNIHNKIEFRDIIAIENLFVKIASRVKDEDTKDILKNISMLKNTDKSILRDLQTHCKNKNQLIILYKSPKSGPKEIEIIADKLAFKSEKLYLWGTSITHCEYSYLRLDRILEILAIKMKKNEEHIQNNRVVYEVYNNENYTLEAGENIIEKTDDKIVIEAFYQNKFEIMQKFLYLAQDCKIVSPQGFKDEFVEKLRTMKESYL